MNCSKCLFETRRLSKTEDPALDLVLFLVYIFTEINHRRKHSLSGATLRDTNYPNNKQLKINQFITWKVKKDQKLMKLGTKVVQNWAEKYLQVFSALPVKNHTQRA